MVRMLKFKCNVFILATLFALATAELPSYIKKCSKSDKNIGECIVNIAKKATADISKGDKNLGLPNLAETNPVDQNINISENFNYQLKNIKAISDALVPLHASMNFETDSLTLGLYMRYLTWIADYELKGSINDKTIHETGNVNITFDGLYLNYTKNLGTTEIDGKMYYQITSDETVARVNNFIFRPDNQQSTSSELNDAEKKEYNQLIEKVKTEIQIRLKNICGDLVSYILNTILKTTPKNNLFLP